ncbi:MAG: divalent-cation tolerance protein CutA [Puniceicoccales bacterium]|jgi:periplasmic divalent cation tolerance protein|nr:divalent-cation tolerance protein CutA [Puniceicoccales bacterium]
MPAAEQETSAATSQTHLQPPPENGGSEGGGGEGKSGGGDGGDGSGGSDDGSGGAGTGGCPAAVSNPNSNRAPALSDSDAVCIGWTTFPDRKSARQFAESLVKSRLAACAQVSAEIESFYHWEGKFCHDPEWRVTVKFLRSRADAVSEHLRRCHPYVVPQWLAVEVSQISPCYHAWLKEVCI